MTRVKTPDPFTLPRVKTPDPFTLPRPLYPSLYHFPELRQVFAKLQQARQEQGLSLTDVQQRTGIDRSSLAKLEKGLQPNPTLDTVIRVAAAVGKRVVVDLVDAPP